VNLETIDALLKNICRKHPERPAFHYKESGIWHDTTYRDLDSMSDRIAAGLIRFGFTGSEKAAILAPSSPLWVAAYFGILKAGGIVVPIDKELKKAELRHILSDCNAGTIFLDHAYIETLDEIGESLPILSRAVILNVPSQSAVSSPMAEQALNELKKEWRNLVSSTSLPPERAHRLEAMAKNVLQLLEGTNGSSSKKSRDKATFPAGKELLPVMHGKLTAVALEELWQEGDVPSPSRASHDTAVILYTSGTTGRSKGAMLSHGNIISNIRSMADHFNLDDSIHTLSFLPINHVFEQVCGILLPLSLGGKISFAESLKKLGDNLVEVKPTFFLGVPAVYKLLVDRIMKNIRGRALSRLLFSVKVTRRLVTSRIRKMFGEETTFISGGAPLDPSIARSLHALGLRIYQGYGITETSPVISAECPGRTRIGTVGAILKDVLVRIDRPNDEGVGEIVVAGPNVMTGYYRNPPATDEALVDGWYHTGDLGRIDEDGFLSICGRVKNLIVTPNGKNVYPEEVEIELLKSPYIAEAMVYGHMTESHTEEVYAIIFPDQEELDNHNREESATPMTEAKVEALIRAEVHAACKNLADYKRVKKFTLREDEFPKTTTRKIKRFVVEADIPA
jgi:long-chain acyl-CoA synthetase